MALKDWELTSKTTNDIYWRKGLEVISIHKIEKGSLIWEEYKANFMFYTNRYSRQKPVYFKTKSQALRFVKGYMRSH